MHEKGLDKAKQYYELLTAGGENVLKFLDTYGSKYSYDEYKSLIDMIYDEALTASEEGSIYRKQYAYCVQKLKDHFLKHR